MTGTPPPAGWYPDPQGRYEERRWDGFEWTREVRNGGPVKRRPLAIVGGVLAVVLALGGCGALVAVAEQPPGAGDDCTELFFGEAAEYVDEHPPPDGIDAEELADDLEGFCLVAADEDEALTFEEARREALALQSSGGEAF